MAADLFGQAMLDFHTGLGSTKLMVSTQVVRMEELPVHHFFREWKDMPEVEQMAIEHCRGKVLDMGAGAGAHALELQRRGHSVTAVDSSPGAVRVMKMRGVKDPVCDQWESFKNGGFDTVLLLMNGIGLAGTLDGLAEFTSAWDQWLNPDGIVLFESTDVAYVYQFPEGSNPLELEPYYGEQTYKMRYGHEEVQFPWLFADEVSLRERLRKLGWGMEVLSEDGVSFLVKAYRL